MTLSVRCGDSHNLHTTAIQEAHCCDWWICRVHQERAPPSLDCGVREGFLEELEGGFKSETWAGLQISGSRIMFQAEEPVYIKA